MTPFLVTPQDLETHGTLGPEDLDTWGFVLNGCLFVGYPTYSEAAATLLTIGA